MSWEDFNDLLGQDNGFAPAHGPETAVQGVSYQIIRFEKALRIWHFIKIFLRSCSTIHKSKKEYQYQRPSSDS